MATGSIVTNSGLKVMLNRAFKGTPDYAQPTIFKVGTDTTTPTVSDTDLGAAVTIDADTLKDFVSGYPVIDETNLQITFRGLILTTEANSNSLTEFGIFNEDSSPLMFSRAVHSAISKTSSIEVSYVEKDKFE